MSEYKNHKKAVVFVSLCIIAALIWCIAALLSVDGRDFWNAASPIASLVSAIGGFSAALAAVWIGLDAIRHRGRHEAIRARLVAVSLLPVIAQMKFHATTLRGSIGAAKINLRIPPGPRNEVYESGLRESLAGLLGKLSLEELAHLAPVSLRGAEALAAAHSLISLLHSDIVVAGLDTLSARTINNAYSPPVKRWTAWLERLECHLLVGEEACALIKHHNETAVQVESEGTE